MRLFPLLTALSTFLFLIKASGQGGPIGTWRAHYNYNASPAIALGGGQIFVCAGPGFFTHDRATGLSETYSKVNGMADVAPSYVAYDDATGTAVIAYPNSNIDLFREGSGFRNIPDLRLKVYAGSKAVNSIYAADGLAYLSTGLGIVVVDLRTDRIRETYTITAAGEVISVAAFARSGSHLYAATARGLYRAPRTAPELQALAVWARIDSASNLVGLVETGGGLFAASPAVLYRFNAAAATLDTVYQPAASATILHLDAGPSGPLLSEARTGAPSGIAKRMQADGTAAADSFTVGRPAVVMEDLDGTLFAADRFRGLLQRTTGTDFRAIVPGGPEASTSYDIYASAGDVLVAHGRYDERYAPGASASGFSRYREGAWTSYTLYNYPPFGDSMRDIVAIARAADGTVCLGSIEHGLMLVHPNGEVEAFKQGSPIEAARPGFGSALHPVVALAFDGDGSLLVGQFAVGGAEMARREAGTGTWTKYTTPVSEAAGIRAKAAAGLLADPVTGIKWWYVPQGGGLFAYNDGGTPDNTADDAYRWFRAGEGQGGLPTSNVLSIAADRDGALWVGTDDGVAIIQCAGAATDDGCDATLPVVQFDQFAGYLFDGEIVSTIAVDGANRKWVGTGTGVWLISPAGDSVIARYTAANSPLPQDAVRTIAIDGGTGDVYIGTDAGLVSFRSTATDGGTETAASVLTFPNPVPSGYSGTIAIRGLTEGADVRITDVAGQLVYRTRALGGQAVWDGKDYTGRRPQSGVYLVLATNADGTQTYSGKIVFME